MKKSRPFEGFFILHVGACDSVKWNDARNMLFEVDLLEMMCYEDSRMLSIVKPISKKSNLEFSKFDLSRLQSMREQLDSISRIPNWVKREKGNYKLSSDMGQDMSEISKMKKKSGAQSKKKKTAPVK
jgi:hypothetical protein